METSEVFWITMPYLIDGHNLIPKIPGIHLSGMDDEQQLIEVLQAYCRKRRKQVEVFFDGAPASRAGTFKYGVVKAHFVRQGKTADRAIQERLLNLGSAARNWIVVSSDHAVQASARTSHAAVQTSDHFAREIAAAEMPTPDSGQSDDRHLSPEELEEWLTLFGTRKQN
jgi:predicted RNA-binding protein with PIN domain